MARLSKEALEAKRDALNARLRQITARNREKERKDDTRRKVLGGAVVFNWAERDAAFKTQLHAELDRALTRDDDRALFGLPPLPAKLSS